LPVEHRLAGVALLEEAEIVHSRYLGVAREIFSDEVKMEPDRGYPQGATAHDTFWDFISLLPESIHRAILLWKARFA
jgi:hypothetical protein